MSACEHGGDCPLFRLFTMSSNLGIWKQNYCEAEWQRCERRRRVIAGEAIPLNLLPNGRVLAVPTTASRKP